MNDALVELKLGPAALQYILERLAQGKTLASHLLRRKDLADGRITTCLPAGLPEGEAQEFTTGYKLKRDPATFR
jgi:hypothetical protein